MKYTSSNAMSEVKRYREMRKSCIYNDLVAVSSPSTPSFLFRASLTQVTKLNISVDDNFITTNSKSTDASTLVADDNSDYHKTEQSDLSITAISDSDESICANSENGNIIHRNESCHYKKRKQSTRRMLRFDGKPTRDNQKAMDCNTGIKYKTDPIACSTMIDCSETIVADDMSVLSGFVPAASSTMMNEFIPRASSTVLKETSKILQLTTNCNMSSCTEVETWSVNESEGTIPIQQNYHRRYRKDRHSICCSADILSTIAAETICRDEFSLDMDYRDASYINKNNSLPRSSTVTQPNANKVQLPANNEQCQAVNCRDDCKKHKQPQTLLRLKQVMKNVNKGLIKKSKQNQIEQTKEEKDEIFKKPAVPEVRIQNKQAVARKLHRFRESFRRKDTRQLHTLATL